MNHLRPFLDLGLLGSFPLVAASCRRASFHDVACDCLLIVWRSPAFGITELLLASAFYLRGTRLPFDHLALASLTQWSTHGSESDFWL